MKYKLAAIALTMAFATPAFAEDAVCYNCPRNGRMGLNAESD